MDLSALANILIETLTEEQIDQVLQVLSDKIDNNDGCCPICDEQEYPVDNQGVVIVGDDISGAAEWTEQHADDCIVTLIEQHRALQTCQHCGAKLFAPDPIHICKSKGGK